MKKHRQIHPLRLLSLLLAVFMLFTLLPSGVIAATVDELSQVGATADESVGADTYNITVHCYYNTSGTIMPGLWSISAYPNGTSGASVSHTTGGSFSKTFTGFSTSDTTPALNLKNHVSGVTNLAIKQVIIYSYNGTNITTQAFGSQAAYDYYIESCRTSLYGYVELQGITSAYTGVNVGAISGITINVVYEDLKTPSSYQGTRLMPVTVVTKGDVRNYYDGSSQSIAVQATGSPGFFSNYTASNALDTTYGSANTGYKFNVNGDKSSFNVSDGGQFTRYLYQGTSSNIYFFSLDNSDYAYIESIKFYNNKTGSELTNGGGYAADYTQVTAMVGNKVQKGKYFYINRSMSPDNGVTIVVTYKEHTYDITWKDGNNSTLKTDTVRYGETPSYSGNTPTKTATAQYSYTFNNTWSPAITAASANATYTAQFNSTVRKYTVTWKNSGGYVLETDTNVPYGTTPTYDGSTPKRSSDAQYSYTFSGWSPAVSAVKGDVTYTATYTSTVNEYTITWKNSDGTVLKTEKVPYGSTPSYSGETPTKASNSQYNYSFSGWTPKVGPVTKAQTYTADFSLSLREFTVTWKNTDGTVLRVDENVVYGSTVSYSGDTPQREYDGNYYSFKGWSPTPSSTYIRGDTVFTATYDTYHLVTWQYNDGTVIDTELVKSGEYVDTHAAPNREDTPAYTYTFRGWNPDPTYRIIDSDTTFTALYNEYPVYYCVLWKNENGSTLQSQSYAYGSTPYYSEPTPYKASDAQYSYTFSGWSPEISPVTEDAEYTAQFTPTLRTYTVTWNNVEDDYDEVVRNVPYGTIPSYSGTPTKYSNSDNYYYVFKGWDREIEAVTGNVSYTAQYEPVYYTYTVIYKNTDDTVLQTYTVNSGSSVPSYTGETPTYEDERYVYTFIGWLPDSRPTQVKENLTYTAQYRTENRLYPIHWDLDGDGVYDVTTYETYGSDLYQKYNGFERGEDIHPHKEQANGYGYYGNVNSDQWEPPIEPVTGEAYYKATFEEVRYKMMMGHSLTLQGDIGVNFFLNVTPEEVAQNVTVKFNWYNCQSEYKVTQADYDTNTGFYKARCNVAAAEMSYTIHAQVYINGEEPLLCTYYWPSGDDSTVPLQGETYDDYSVREYGLYIINHPDTYGADLVNLAKAMLDYGAKAQTAFNRTDVVLANSGVDYTMQSVSGADFDNAVANARGNEGKAASVMTDGTEAFGIKYYTTSLVYLTKSTLRHYYTVTDQAALDAVKDSASFTFSDRKAPYVYFEHENIGAADLDTLQAFTIGDKTYYFSALDFAKNIFEKASSSQANKDLAAATYWYNHYANEYFDKLGGN